MTEDEKAITTQLEKQINRVKRGPRSSPSIISQVSRQRSLSSCKGVSTSNQQRDILKRLIELAGNPHPTVKSFVAKHIQLYINEFRELEDDAINAVYDLCEDQDTQVRCLSPFLEYPQTPSTFPRCE